MTALESSVKLVMLHEQISRAVRQHTNASIIGVELSTRL
jgi:hypothetical protein